MEQDNSCSIFLWLMFKNSCGIVSVPHVVYVLVLQSARQVSPRTLGRGSSLGCGLVRVAGHNPLDVEVEASGNKKG